MYNPCSLSCNHNIVSDTVFARVNDLMEFSGIHTLLFQVIIHNGIAARFSLGFKVIKGSFIFPTYQVCSLDGAAFFVPAPFFKNLG